MRAKITNKRLFLFVSILLLLIFLYSSYNIFLANKKKTIQDYNKSFELVLYTDKQTYKITDKISIWATLKYIGSDNQVKIWHGNPYINFSITNGKQFNTQSYINTELTFTLLEKNKLYRYDYVKNGGYSNDDPNAAYWKEFYETEDLFLPEGEYDIIVAGDFSINEDSTIYSGLTQKVRIKIEK